MGIEPGSSCMLFTGYLNLNRAVVEMYDYDLSLR